MEFVLSQFNKLILVRNHPPWIMLMLNPRRGIEFMRTIFILNLFRFIFVSSPVALYILTFQEICSKCSPRLYSKVWMQTFVELLQLPLLLLCLLILDRIKNSQKGRDSRFTIRSLLRLTGSLSFFCLTTLHLLNMYLLQRGYVILYAESECQRYMPDFYKIAVLNYTIAIFLFIYESLAYFAEMKFADNNYN